MKKYSTKVYKQDRLTKRYKWPGTVRKKRLVTDCLEVVLNKMIRFYCTLKGLNSRGICFLNEETVYKHV